MSCKNSKSFFPAHLFQDNFCYCTSEFRICACPEFIDEYQRTVIGNLQKELSGIGEEAGEGTEIQNITLYKLMKSFEKAMQRMYDRNHRPVHTVVSYNYTMEGSREFLLKKVQAEKTTAFEKIFDLCENRIHALFIFLSLLELSQQRYMSIITGEGRNNFIIEFNENREEDVEFILPPKDSL